MAGAHEAGCLGGDAPFRGRCACAKANAERLVVHERLGGGAQSSSHIAGAAWRQLVGRARTLLREPTSLLRTRRRLCHLVFFVHGKTSGKRRPRGMITKAARPKGLITGELCADLGMCMALW